MPLYLMTFSSASKENEISTRHPNLSLVCQWRRSITRRLAHTIRRPEHEIYLSVVSLWECIIKHNLGKLPLPGPPETYLPVQRERHRIVNLALDEPSVRRLATLPSIHRDPFDRMLICQALEQGMSIIAADQQFRKYPVSILEHS